MFNKLTLIIGIIMGIVAIVLINVHVSTIKRNEDSVTVLRATQFISAGTSPDGRYELVTVPRRLANALPNPIFVRDRALIRSKNSIEDIRQGSFLLWSHIEESRQRLERTVMKDLQKGKRAMAVPVKFTSAVAGWVRPDDRVDVLATFSRADEKGNPESYVLTVKQNMRVLAVGWKDRRTETMVRGRAVDRHPKSVILEVSPIEAELLNFTISQKAPIILTLRSPADTENETLPVMGIDVFMHERDKTRPSSLND